MADVYKPIDEISELRNRIGRLEIKMKEVEKRLGINQGRPRGLNYG